MTLRQLSIVVVFAGLLTACGSGPPKRITPSVVSIQELATQSDGQWRLSLRVQNYSTVPMQYETIHATLYVAGVDVGTLDLKPALDIPPNSADVFDASLRSSAKLPNGDFEYRIEGTIDTSEPKEHFKFSRTSRLSPAPGLPGTWR
jgi:LEA14-like dessication related protein